MTFTVQATKKKAPAAKTKTAEQLKREADEKLMQENMAKMKSMPLPMGAMGQMPPMPTGFGGMPMPQPQPPMQNPGFA